MIKTSKLKELLDSIALKPNRVVTIESLLSKILRELVHKPGNVSYGLYSYYEKDESLRLSKFPLREDNSY